MARDVTDTTPIESRDQLVAWIEKGCKPRSAYRIGTEHEKFPFYRANHAPVPYQESRASAPSSPACSKASAGSRSSTVGNLIGLADGTGLGRDLARARWPVRIVRRAARNGSRYRARAQGPSRAAACGRAPLDVGFLGLGHSPTWTREETPIMPQAPLRHHARLYAEGRHARARHDAAHLDRAGQSRLLLAKPTW